MNDGLIDRRSLLPRRSSPPSATGAPRRGSSRGDMVPLIGPGYNPTDKDERAMAADGAGRGRSRRIEPCSIQDPGVEASYLQSLIGKCGRSGRAGFPDLSGANPRVQRE